MTNTKKPNQEKDQEHISQESEVIYQETEETDETDETEDTKQTELYYDGNTWVKYTIDYQNHQESSKKVCSVIFPLESNKWIWDYTLLKKNKTIIVDCEEYKIIGFSWQCYDGIMKKNSSIQIQKI
jgi:hypothetical protein